MKLITVFFITVALVLLATNANAATQSGGQSSSQKAATLQLDDEEEDDEVRALERALVQKGGLLLPSLGLEIAPSVAYSLVGSDSVFFSEEGAVPLKTRIHYLQNSLVGRLGLPWDFQVEGKVSYAGARRNTVLAKSISRNQESWGIGDSQVSLTYQLFRGRSSIPDLLLTAFYKLPTGSSPYKVEANRLALGNGLRSLGGTLSLIKTNDPLVFLANLSYEVPQKIQASIGDSSGTLKVGNQLEVMIGALLAVSPDTSLSFALNQKYSPVSRIDGKELAGTDSVSHTFQLGVAVVVSSDLFLNITSGIGLTADAPAFQLGISAPIRVF